MADSRRIEWFLGRAGLLPPPQQIPNLVEPPAQDYEPFIKANRDAARQLLVQQRMADPSYRPPSEQKRNLFRTKHQKEEASNHSNWTFSKHEVARAFDLLLSTEPLPAAAGVAQALLLYTTLTSLDELWGHLHDSRLEKKMKRNRLSSAVDSFPPGITWLDKAASHDNIDYIHLLCQSRVSQEALTRAFGISLSKSSSDAMRLLLSYGAAASSYSDAVAQHIRIGDLALVSLLLSAPTAMTTGAWLECLEKDLARAMAGTGFSPEIFLLCVANRRDLVCDSLLLATLRAQSLQALAVLLAYASSNDKFFGVRESACELATLVPDSTQRLSFFTLLAEAGLVGDYPVLREELVKSVKAHQIPFAKLLVGAGVSVDIPPHNALQWAVSQMDFVMMELVKNGAFSSPVSLALSYVPESTSELDMIHLMDIFGPMGVSGEHLDAHLVRAVRKKHLRLVETLVRCGASVEYEQASAIQCALEAVDFSMLKVLLQRKCSPEVLSATIPAAMGISPRDSRLQAIKSILQKGVHSQVLGVPLQQVVSEDGDIDSDLIQLFLEHHAPVDLSNTADGNPLLVAARRGNPSVLQMLCTGGPRTETLSVAVPIAFKAMEKFGYDVALAMITLLLQKGANGKAVDQTLMEASSKDTRLDIVRALVEHRANANYGSGLAYINAVERGNLELLKILCSGCPPSPQSLTVVFHSAMRPEYYNLKTLELILDSAPSSHILQAPAGIEGMLRGHPNLAEVVPCLVRHGLSVDTGSGMLLCSAVQDKNVALLGTLVSSKPHTTSLAAAFQEATTVEPRGVRLEMMKLLLEAAGSVEIGQSEYLPLETKAALSGGIVGLELLLSHKASVDVQGGRALQEAAEEGVPEVLKILLVSNPTALTVEKAFIVGSSSSVASHTKAVILGHLLKTDQVSVDAVSKALTECVSKHPDDILLAKLLVSYHAKVDIDTLKMALESSPVDMFLSLSRTISEPAIAKELFRHVRNSDIDSERRFIAYQSLVGKDIDADEVSEALIDSIKSDPDNLDTPNLLLDNGAVVNYKDGAAFTMAFESSNLRLVRALSRHLVKADESAATLAFDYVSNNASFDSEVRLEIYSCLLEFSISKESLNKALVGALESTATNTAIVSLLVEHGADPNAEEANCFVLACKKNSRDEFRALSKHADLTMVLSAILDNVKEELEVMNWLILLFEEQPAGTKVQEDELLFKCMRKFPQGTLVLGFLLDHGVPASAKIICNLRPMWELEECTALMWAISSSLKIDNNVIIRLLQMEDSALPTYVTPQSQMSAVFLCLLDKSRTPVLKALLELAPGDMFNSTVSGSDFSKIACYPKKPKADFQSLFEEEDEISPREAALFLGNIDAFKLLAGEGTPDDGTLHLASLLALPDFVTWLLETHDANYEEENFGFMVPLALACFSKSFPWCKIANEESEWNLRLRETMKILIAKTRKTWRYREKLVLHIALENGPDVTKAMLDALDIRHEADKDKTYLYTDRTGLHYSPCEYVEEFVEAEALQKKKLVKCLTGQGLT